MEEKRYMPHAAATDSEKPALALPVTKTPLFNISAARFWQGRWLILGATAAFTLIGLMLGALSAPLFKVQALIEVHAPSQAAATDSDQHAGSPSLASYMQTEVRIAQSRSLLERALGKLSDSERERLLEPRYFISENSTYDQNLESIRKRLSAQAAGQANILEIFFLAPDAGAGAHLLNALTQELADYTAESSWRLAQHRREWTDRQLDDLRRRWEQSEQLLAEYLQTINAAPRAPTSTSTRRSANSEPSDAKVTQLKRRLADLNHEINQWISLYGVSSPSVARLQSEAASVTAAIRARRFLTNKSPGNAVISPESAPAPADTFNKPEVIAHLNVLRQEAESNRRIYQSASTRLQEARISPATQIGDINIVDPATAGGNPVSPNQLVNGSLGAIAGLLMSVAFVALRDRYSRTFAGPGLLRDYLGLEVLGSVPGESRAAAIVPLEGENSNEPVLNLSYGHDAETAEAYRSIRSAIFFKAAQGAGPRRLVLTSAAETEGKTTVTGNLGAALASAQRRVLLVDGDLRNPGLHKVFGASNEHGLADLLSRQLSASPVSSRDVIRATQVPGLYLLSAGQAGAMAPEILSALQLPQLIVELAKGFDFVLIDSPPALPYSDARILARAADAAVLIVKAAVTSRQAAVAARDAISRDGITILGSVLTDWDKSRQAHV